MPTKDAPMVECLREAGAIVTGKTTTPQRRWRPAVRPPIESGRLQHV